MLLSEAGGTELLAGSCSYENAEVEGEKEKNKTDK